MKITKRIGCIILFGVFAALFSFALYIRSSHLPEVSTLILMKSYWGFLVVMFILGAGWAFIAFKPNHNPI